MCHDALPKDFPCPPEDELIKFFSTKELIIASVKNFVDLDKVDLTDKLLKTDTKTVLIENMDFGNCKYIKIQMREY